MIFVALFVAGVILMATGFAADANERNRIPRSGADPDDPYKSGV